MERNQVVFNYIVYTETLNECAQSVFNPYKKSRSQILTSFEERYEGH